MKKLTHEEFVSKLKTKNPKVFAEILEFINKYTDAKTKIKVKTSYGTCHLLPSELLKSKTIGIKSSINKTLFYINKANEVHNYKYEYNKTIYRSGKKKITITCLRHGDFLQEATSHLMGIGCPKCSSEKTAKNQRKSNKWFLKKAKEIHEEEYLYHNTKYIKSTEKVVITCKIHGDFKILPSAHLSGSGCQKCSFMLSSLKQRKSKEMFIQEAKIKHGDKYNYEKVDYINSLHKITIFCPQHGEFSQFPAKHLGGQGCPICGMISRRNYKIYEDTPCLVYIIKCWNSNEEFYKIGLTSNSVKRRFETYSSMPYSYEVLKIKDANMQSASFLEKKLHTEHKEYSYTPEIKFGGYTECFSNLNWDIVNEFFKKS